MIFGVITLYYLRQAFSVEPQCTNFQMKMQVVENRLQATGYRLFKTLAKDFILIPFFTFAYIGHDITFALIFAYI